MLFSSRSPSSNIPDNESPEKKDLVCFSPESIRHTIEELSAAGGSQAYLNKNDDAARLFRPIAKALRNKNFLMLNSIVNIWVEQTNPLLTIADMFRDMRELGKRSQSMAAASEEMTASIKEVGRSAETVAQDAQNVKSELTGSMKSVNEALTSMEGISAAFNGLTDKVHTLDKASEQIAAILKTIEKIAAQTNLLALNATIEAARAGEAGKGFAVVASEVKNLAKQTSGATEDIRQRITALQEGMSDMLSSMNEGDARVLQGKTVIQSVSDSIHAVGARVDDVTEKMVNVSSTVKEQTIVVGEVSQNIAIIADMSQALLGHCSLVTRGIQKSSEFVQAGLGEVTQSLDTDMLVLVTKSDHATYKKNIIDTLLGSGSAKSHSVTDHHNCRLGKWYEQQNDPDIVNLPAFKKLQDPHQRVHTHGRRALEFHEKDDPAAALEEAKLLDKASSEVIQILDEIHNAIKTKYE